mmetsp:Transcript_52504/g.112439  ORF Transcript_52504/g.112439 Transcript_52504/m.112439 type:complete len:340 (-) Transcript_52504:143-1162(-)
MHVKKKGYKLRRRQPLQIEPVRLLGHRCIPRCNQPLHTLQRWRRVVEPLKPESLLGGIRLAIQDLLLPRAEGALPLPACHRGGPADLDVQHAAALEPVATVAEQHDSDVAGLVGLRHTRGFAEAFVGRHPLEHVKARLVLAHHRSLVKTDLISGPLQVFRHPILSTFLHFWALGNVGVLLQDRLEKRRRAPRHTHGGHWGLEVGQVGFGDGKGCRAGLHLAPEGLPESGGIHIRGLRIDLIHPPNCLPLREVCHHLLPVVVHQHVHHPEIHHAFFRSLLQVVGFHDGCRDASHHAVKRSAGVVRRLVSGGHTKHHGVVHDSAGLQELSVALHCRVEQGG